MDQFIVSIEYFMDDLKATDFFGQLFQNNSNRNEWIKYYEDKMDNNITKNFISNLYIIWFGNFDETNFHINDNILNSFYMFYSSYLKKFKKEKTPKSLDIENLQPYIKELGFSRILPKNLSPQTTVICLQFIIKLCEHILEFDNKHIDSDFVL